MEVARPNGKAKELPVLSPNSRSKLTRYKLFILLFLTFVIVHSRFSCGKVDFRPKPYKSMTEPPKNVSIEQSHNRSNLIDRKPQSNRSHTIQRVTTPASFVAKRKDKLTVSKSEYFIVLVLISRTAFEALDAIKKTWASGHNNVYYLVGGQHCEFPPEQRKPWVCEKNNKALSPQRIEEYHKHEREVTQKLQSMNNVVLLPMVDVYRNLAIKLKMAYLWALKHTNASYVAKVDADTFVRVDSTMKWLKSRKGRSTYECIVGGLQGGRVARSGKWAEKKYKKARYPPFPKGAGHIISRSVIEYLGENPGSFVTYQGEDTSLGIWFDSIPINIKYVTTKLFTTHSGNCHNKKQLIVGHDISPKKMFACYRTMDERA